MVVIDTKKNKLFICNIPDSNVTVDIYIIFRGCYKFCFYDSKFQQVIIHCQLDNGFVNTINNKNKNILKDV
jgi:hypothetical protein